VPVTVPRYFDLLIEGFRSGRAGRNVHLGYWDEPPPLAKPCSPAEFETAQARLTEILIHMADLRDGQDVLDVGCGFGGTLEAVGKWQRIRRAAVNVDGRQLDICRTLPATGNPLWLVLADACALPFRAASFDRVLCVEAMFHFRARDVFLREAAQVLRRGGRLVLSDILLRQPAEPPTLSAAAIEAVIGSEYGPWPRPFVSVDEIVKYATQAGLRPEQTFDATRQTLPTYRITAPQEREGLPPRPSASSMLRWLHASGHLSYLCLSFIKD
jgi:cyclopropane fatty-acyl-phospholipid synthase-like methyltransferase